MYVGETATSPGNTVKVSIVVDGVEQPLFRRPGYDRTFVATVPMRPYVLRVRNITGVAIEVIATVDGRHVLKDEPGDKQDNYGMLIRPHDSYDFTGWRVDNEGANDFVFGTPARLENAIAARATGSAENVGVIGFAVHREQRVPIMRGGFRGGLESFGPAPHMMEAPPRTLGGDGFATRGGSVGTEMGSYREDRVVEVPFTRDGLAPDVLVIGYDTEEVLRAQGILAPAEPNPFPGAKTGYAKYASQL